MISMQETRTGWRSAGSVVARRLLLDRQAEFCEGSDCAGCCRMSIGAGRRCRILLQTWLFIAGNEVDADHIMPLLFQ